MAEGTEAQVDGTFATIVDLSTLGAQILCATPLKPQQRVRMILADDLGLVKCGCVRRVGVLRDSERASRVTAPASSSTDAEASTIDAFCKRHKLSSAVPTPNHSAAADFSRTIVSLRPDPVDTIDTGTPLASSRNATYRCASRGRSS